MFKVALLCALFSMAACEAEDHNSRTLPGSSQITGTIQSPLVQLASPISPNSKSDIYPGSYSDDVDIRFGNLGGKTLGNNPHIPILRSHHEQDNDGSYNFAYQTANGIQFQERGYIKDDGHEGAKQVQGSYSYTGPDGVQYTVRYTADENGFHPEGDHLPTPPPVPEAIQNSLAENAAEEQVNQEQEVYHQGLVYTGNGYQY